MPAKARELMNVGDAEIGGWLFHEILKQLEITQDQFDQLK